VSDLLTSQGIKHLFIHGSLSFSERQRVLKEFKSPLGADVLLMTLGTGAVGYVKVNPSLIPYELT